MTQSKKTPDFASNPSALRDPTDLLLHGLKQPLNAIRVTAQGLRLDVAKDRLDLESLPELLRDIEAAVDELAAKIDRFREDLKKKEV